MQANNTQATELEQEHDALAHAGSLHWFHWAIVVLSALVTIAAWHFSKNQIEEKARMQFDREATQVTELVLERMKKYEDALWGGVAAIQSGGGAMAHGEWRIYADSLHIASKYPGIGGIGVIVNVLPQNLAAHIESQQQLRPDYRVHPNHLQQVHMPIVYIEPEAANLRAVGLDMAHEINRQTAANKARDTGTTQITGPIVLVQDESKTPGFLFYAPYYAGGSYATEVERQQQFVGMVYAPFIVNKLMAGALDKDKRHVGIHLADGSQVIYDENTAAEEDFDPNPIFTRQTTLDLYGRSWNFDIWSTQSFREALASNQPIFILIGGIMMDALLLTLFLLLSRASRRTLNYADRMTVELRHKAAELEQSNADLESFAYIASHDLKTPLRGIGDLTEYLQEDLESYVATPDANPDVQHNLQRLQQQTGRMENLIKGILDYSSVGASNDAMQSVDVLEVLHALRSDLNVRADQLICEGSFPVLTANLVRFEQVMHNLVGNAFKYHHDPQCAVVTVACTDNGNFFEFRVSDNGPGIDPKFHARIFEVFQTLQSKDEIDSTGVGLAIVKKSVEALGGSINVASTLGAGTTFRFKWPKTIPHEQNKTLAVN